MRACTKGGPVFSLTLLHFSPQSVRLCLARITALRCLQVLFPGKLKTQQAHATAGTCPGSSVGLDSSCPRQQPGDSIEGSILMGPCLTFLIRTVAATFSRHSVLTGFQVLLYAKALSSCDTKICFVQLSPQPPGAGFLCCLFTNVPVSAYGNVREIIGTKHFSFSFLR